MRAFGGVPYSSRKANFEAEGIADNNLGLSAQF
jgi:hypothetical protein